MTERPAEILGIFLVRNEDIYLEQAVLNVVDFCDRIIIADNYSEDRTWDIAKRLAATSAKVECVRIRKTGDSHDLVQPYAGTRTWVFGVDGDEIYDPAGLARFRKPLLDGRFDRWWILFGNVLNCTAIDRATRQATGYLAPPCRSMTKLYNFAAISRWDGPCIERMLGGTPVFHEGFDLSLRLNLHEQVSWEASDYRCLHTCFLRRSSGARADGERQNPLELSRRSRLERMGLGFLDPRRRRAAEAAVSYKQETYARGELVTKDVSAFFPPEPPA
jgi:hypothetical protein